MKEQSQIEVQHYQYPNYQKMSILQLKKEKFKMIDEIKELHETVQNKLFKIQQEDEYVKENVVRSIKTNNRIMQSLKDSLNNFDFMLTHQYISKINQEIEEDKVYKKQLKNEISSLRKEMMKPIQIDNDICEGLQKQCYDLQMMLQEKKYENKKKRQKVREGQSKVKDKVHKIKQFRREQQRLQQLIEEVGPHIDHTNRNRYDELVRKKDKILNLMEKAEKVKRVQEKTKVNQINKVQRNIQFVKNCIIETFQKIQDKQLQLKKQQAKKERKHKKKTEIKLQRLQQKYSRFLTQPEETKERSYLSYSRNGHQFSHSRQRRYTQLPALRETDHQKEDNTFYKRKSEFVNRLYNALGKSKLLIEEECDLKDLVYQ